MCYLPYRPTHTHCLVWLVSHVLSALQTHSHTLPCLAGVSCVICLTDPLAHIALFGWCLMCYLPYRPTHTHCLVWLVSHVLSALQTHSHTLPCLAGVSCVICLTDPLTHIALFGWCLMCHLPYRPTRTHCLVWLVSDVSSALQTHSHTLPCLAGV